MKTTAQTGTLFTSQKKDLQVKMKNQLYKKLGGK